MNGHPTKIAFLLPDLRGGGAQRMILNMANEFVTRGYTVYLMIVEDIGPYKLNIHERIRIEYFHCSRAVSALFPLMKALRWSRPDILYSAMPYMNMLAILGKYLSGCLGVKTVVSERNYFSMNAGRNGKPPSLIQKLSVGALYPLADKIVGISKGVAEDIQKYLFCGQDKVTWIHNPVVSAETMAQLNMDCRDPWFDGREKPVIVTSGRLVVQKDQKTLLNAFALLLKRRPAQLLVLGEGPLLAELEALADKLGIREKVFFKGFVATPLSYMKKADLFVLSSAWEGFCNVVVEALLCGLPVVSTDCPSGPSEILEDGKYGRLAPVGNIAALAAAMEEAIEKGADPEVQKKRAMDFSVGKICDQYEKLFQSLMKVKR